MKKLTIAIFIPLFAFAACGSRGGIKTGTDITEETKAVKPIELNKAEFTSRVSDIAGEWNYLGDKPAIIDFYATWCGPCRVISPVLEKLAGEYSDRLYVYKVDVDKNPELAAAFGVRSIPTLLFISMEGKPNRVTGAIPEEKFIEIIDSQLLAE